MKNNKWFTTFPWWWIRSTPGRRKNQSFVRACHFTAWLDFGYRVSPESKSATSCREPSEKNFHDNSFPLLLTKCVWFGKKYLRLWSKSKISCFCGPHPIPGSSSWYLWGVLWSVQDIPRESPSFWGNRDQEGWVRFIDLPWPCKCRARKKCIFCFAFVSTTTTTNRHHRRRKRKSFFQSLIGKSGTELSTSRRAWFRLIRNP